MPAPWHGCGRGKLRNMSICIHLMASPHSGLWASTVTPASVLSRWTHESTVSTNLEIRILLAAQLGQLPVASWVVTQLHLGLNSQGPWPHCIWGFSVGKGTPGRTPVSPCPPSKA